MFVVLFVGAAVVPFLRQHTLVTETVDGINGVIACCLALQVVSNRNRAG